MQRKKANRQHLFSSEALSKPVRFVPRSTQEVCNADAFRGGGGHPEGASAQCWQTLAPKQTVAGAKFLSSSFDLRSGRESEDDIKEETSHFHLANASNVCGFVEFTFQRSDVSVDCHCLLFIDTV